MQTWSQYRQGPPTDGWQLPNPTGGRVIDLNEHLCECGRIVRYVFGQKVCNHGRDQLDLMVERVMGQPTP